MFKRALSSRIIDTLSGYTSAAGRAITRLHNVHMLALTCVQQRVCVGGQGGSSGAGGPRTFVNGK